MKIGLFFGSFNPIHIGHALIARYALEEFKLNQVQFVVSPHNPFKNEEEYDFKGDIEKVKPEYLSSLSHRVQMAKDVCKQMSASDEFVVSDVEYTLPKPSYTCDTLRHIVSQKENKGHAFYIIMGADCYKDIDKWKDFKYILKKFPILVYDRPGTNNYLFDEYPGGDKIPGMKVRFFGNHMIDISSTMIKKRIKENKSVQYMVPDVVSVNIAMRGLYKK